MQRLYLILSSHFCEILRNRFSVFFNSFFSSLRDSFFAFLDSFFKSSIKLLLNNQFFFLYLISFILKDAPIPTGRLESNMIIRKVKRKMKKGNKKIISVIKCCKNVTV